MPDADFFDHAAVGKPESAAIDTDSPAVFAEQAVDRRIIDATDIDEEHHVAAQLVRERRERLLEQRDFAELDSAVVNRHEPAHRDHAAVAQHRHDPGLSVVCEIGALDHAIGQQLYALELGPSSSTRQRVIEERVIRRSEALATHVDRGARP